MPRSSGTAVGLLQAAPEGTTPSPCSPWRGRGVYGMSCRGLSWAGSKARKGAVACLSRPQRQCGQGWAGMGPELASAWIPARTPPAQALGVPWREKLGGGCFLGLASVPSPTPRNLLGRGRCHPGRPCSPLLSGLWACSQVRGGATHHRARPT